MTDTDKRPELGTLSLGQTVIVTRSDQRSPNRHVRAIVTRIGRAWVDVEPEGDGYLLYYERRFRMDTQRTGTGDSREDRFRTEAQYAWDMRLDMAQEYLHLQGLEIRRYSGDTSPWRGRELELANVLRAHEGLDPL